MAEGRPRPINERFDAAVEVIKSLPQEGPFQPSNNVKLRVGKNCKYKTCMPGKVSTSCCHYLFNLVHPMLVFSHTLVCVHCMCLHF